MTKEDIDLVRVALSAYHTKTVYPGCVEAFERIVIEMGSVDKTAKEIVVDALRRDQARRKNEYIKHFERQEAFERIVKGIEMPTPMTIEMEEDERQAALDIVNEQAKDEGLWFNAKYASEAYLQQELRRLHAAVERAALQSALDAQQSNADTVDLDALKEKMISDFEEEKESELGRGYELGLCHAVDYLAQNYNITRKTK